MYSWGDDTSDWATPGAYSYGDSGKAKRDADAAKARSSGPRAYGGSREPNMKIVDPTKHIRSESPNPVIIGVDVTGSMATWPAEIFDRLPLLYNTLAQYRSDLEISFAAIGDAAVDRWPLQVTQFANGFDLEQLLKGIYGEGGGGDAPESYGLFAWWVKHHVQVPKAKRPFLIVFGDITMHAKVPAKQIEHYLGHEGVQDADAIATWQEVARGWNTWFLRKPGGKHGDSVDQQWAQAIGEQQVVHMDDEQRAVDYAMGLIARSWGHFGDFKANMAARQDAGKVAELEKRLDAIPRVLVCPSCAAPLPKEAHGRFTCPFCNATVQL